jgi:predicted MFS family arabinose efflux permease
VRVLLLTAAFVACAFGMIEVSTTAFAEALGNRSAAGVLLSLWGVGSITGGVIFSARRWGRAVQSQYLVLLGFLAAACLLLALPRSFRWMGAAIVLAGLGIAPWISCFYLLVDRLAPPGTASESATWVSTGFAAGMALGRWLAGLAIEARDAHSGLAGAGVLLIFGFSVAWMTRARLVTAGRGDRGSP